MLAHAAFLTTLLLAPAAAFQPSWSRLVSSFVKLEFNSCPSHQTCELVVLPMHGFTLQPDDNRMNSRSVVPMMSEKEGASRREAFQTSAAAALGALGVGLARPMPALVKLYMLCVSSIA